MTRGLAMTRGLRSERALAPREGCERAGDERTERELATREAVTTSGRRETTTSQVDEGRWWK